MFSLKKLFNKQNNSECKGVQPRTHGSKYRNAFAAMAVSVAMTFGGCGGGRTDLYDPEPPCPDSNITCPDAQPCVHDASPDTVDATPLCQDGPSISCNGIREAERFTLVEEIFNANRIHIRVDDIRFDEELDEYLIYLSQSVPSCENWQSIEPIASRNPLPLNSIIGNFELYVGSVYDPEEGRAGVNLRLNRICDDPNLCTESVTSRTEQTITEAASMSYEEYRMRTTSSNRSYRDYNIILDYTTEVPDAYDNWSHIAGLTITNTRNGYYQSGELIGNSGASIDFGPIFFTNLWTFIDPQTPPSIANIGIYDMEPIYQIYSETILETTLSGDPSCAQVYESFEQVSISYTRCLTNRELLATSNMEISELGISGVYANFSSNTVQIGESPYPHAVFLYEGELIHFDAVIIDVHSLTFGMPSACVSLTWENGLEVQTDRERESCSEGGYWTHSGDIWWFSDSESDYVMHLDIIATSELQFFAQLFRITHTFSNGDIYYDGVREWDVDVGCTDADGYGFGSLSFTRRTAGNAE